MRIPVIARMRSIRSNPAFRDCFGTSCLAMTVMISFLLCSPAAAQEWKELRSGHFLVYYLKDDAFARDVSARAEEYYENIASDLGYSRYDNFWTWDSRAKIYIYRSREDYLKATAAKEWSFGLSRYDKREIVSYVYSPKFVKELLPHELAHLIFRDFVGFKGEVPVWLDEGVAQREEEGKRNTAALLLKEYIAKGDIIPLAQLTQMDIAREDDTEISRKFYVEAAALVDFLIDRYGKSSFTFFCRELRDGKTLDKALASAYGSYSVSNVEELEAAWIKYYGGM